MQLDSLLQGGIVAGELCDFVCQWEDFCGRLEGRTVIYMDAFGGSSYPEENRPKHLLPMTAKQLPGYGGNMDTAASDLAHYQKQEFSTLVLCGTRRRAELLQELLHQKNLSASLCIPLDVLPKPGQILLTEGTLPYGLEYPDQKLAILTEGQLIAKTEPRRKPKKTATKKKSAPAATGKTGDKAKKSGKKSPKKKQSLKGLVITLCLECAGILAIVVWWILRIL